MTTPASSGAANRGVRPATENDIDAIHRLIEIYVPAAILLPRTPEKIREDLEQTLVYHNQGEVIGVGNLVNYGDNLYEIRGLSVQSQMQGLGVGRALIEGLLAYLKEKHPEESIKVFALTYIPDFFKHLGWTVTPKENFPQKIFKDCEYCARKLDCPETAVEIQI